MNYNILFALFAMVLFGLSDFFVKKGISKGIDARALGFYSILTASIPFGILCFVQSVPIKVESKLLAYSLIMSVLLFIATLSILSALKIGEASIVIPIGRMGFVITAICAFIFLGEKLTLTKGLGILFAILAIFLLSKE